MRKVNISICILFFISGCEIFDQEYDTYTIKNETEMTLTILAYEKYNFPDELEVPNLSDSIVIKPLDKYFVKKGRGENWMPGGYFTSNYVDSVVVTFNNSKRLLFVCYSVIPSSCLNEKNIMNWHEFSETKCEKNRGCDYTYYITSEDYEIAKDF